MAVQAVMGEEGSSEKPWAAGNGPGKRKRSRRKWCLRQIAQIALEDEVSCIHLMPFPRGVLLHMQSGLR